MMRPTLWVLPAVFAVYMLTCTTPTVRPTMPPNGFVEFSCHGWQ